MKTKIHSLIAASFLIIAIFPTAQAQQVAEILKKWVDITSSPIGQFSLRAIDSGDNQKSSLFKDANGEYKWFMRVDYKKPKGKVAYSISNGYFNCDKSDVSIDQTVEYTKAGVVVNISGEKGGSRQRIPATPDSVAQKSLDFVCSVKFD